MDIYDGLWMWPKIAIEGATTDSEYDLITATYSELGDFLVRAARKRRQHWQPARPEQHRPEERRESSSDATEWVQMTLTEHFRTRA